MSTGIDVYAIGHHVLTPLGSGTRTNLEAIAAGKTAVRQHLHPIFDEHGVFGAFFEEEQWKQINAHDASLTDFENLLMRSVTPVLQQTGVSLADQHTVWIIASTKGNVGELKNSSTTAAAEAGLHLSAQKLAAAGGYHSIPVVVSNACISGITGLLVARRLLRSGHYKHAVVSGADCISNFILAGFKSFQALSNGICKPFDKDRNGLNLGEGAATIVLSTEKSTAHGIRLSGGASTNDANHISGPSRTGIEMATAITRAMAQSNLEPSQLGFISAHGTATPYNDEMESKAFGIAGLENIPAFSLKAYIGHTLGAAGLIEAAISLEAMEQEQLPASMGYSAHGVTTPIIVSKQFNDNYRSKHFLKTGSGFGGCNAAIIFSNTSTQ